MKPGSQKRQTRRLLCGWAVQGGTQLWEVVWHNSPSNLPPAPTPTRLADLQEAQLRKQVCAAIQDADIERAIRLVEPLAPLLLAKLPGLNFKLQCQRFMEMVIAPPPHPPPPFPAHDTIIQLSKESIDLVHVRSTCMGKLWSARPCHPRLRCHVFMVQIGSGSCSKVQLNDTNELDLGIKHWMWCQIRMRRPEEALKFGLDVLGPTAKSASEQELLQVPIWRLPLTLKIQLNPVF